MSAMNTTILSCYYSRDQRRRAEVIFRPVHGYEVALYEDDKLIESRALYEHSKQYAEDCAENWAEGII